MKPRAKQPQYLFLSFESYDQGLLLDAADAALLADILSRNAMWERKGYGSERRIVPVDASPSLTFFPASRIEFPTPSLANAIEEAREAAK